MLIDEIVRLRFELPAGTKTHELSACVCLKTPQTGDDMIVGSSFARILRATEPGAAAAGVTQEYTGRCTARGARHSRG